MGTGAFGFREIRRMGLICKHDTFLKCLRLGRCCKWCLRTHVCVASRKAKDHHGPGCVKSLDFYYDIPVNLSGDALSKGRTRNDRGSQFRSNELLLDMEVSHITVSKQ